MKNFQIIISELLHVFGALYFLVEVTDYFGGNDTSLKIKSYWWLFLVLGLVISFIRLKPKKRFLFKLNDRDITIEFVIGDVFKQPGPIIVGSNTRFIASSDVISPSSIQGIFSKKYFSNPRTISDQIKSQIGDGLQPLGTTVAVRSSNKTGYFCAIADVNERGVAKSSFENIRVSLAELWNYLSSNAEKDVLNIPILGSGFSRVSASREELAKEIIRSFIASTSDHTFCDGIRLVVRKDDIKKYNINVEQLVEFIKYSCLYSIVPPASGVLVGTAET
jgi:Thoeris protein ThsA, Macro domain